MTEPPANLLLLVGTCLFSIWGFNDRAVEEKYLFRPENILAGKEYYRLVTSAFLHANWTHLLANMCSLYWCGPMIEYALGPVHFLVIYFGSVIGGGLLSLYLHRNHDYAAYGASGGVCGVLFVFILLAPNSRLQMFPLPLAMPAWLYAIAFIIASFYAMQSERDNIGHDAHLGGAIVGLLIASMLHPEIAWANWRMLITVLIISGGLLLYLIMNPLFLPISTVIPLPSWPKTIRLPRWPAKRHSPRPPQPAPKPRKPQLVLPEPDWLLHELGQHVGKLDKDKTGRHDWIDKFGRTYEVIRPASHNFNATAFSGDLLDRLNKPGLNFVVVDTRDLADTELSLIKPFLANLPDDQFKRVIRSYAFRAREIRF